MPRQRKPKWKARDVLALAEEACDHSQYYEALGRAIASKTSTQRLGVTKARLKKERAKADADFGRCFRRIVSIVPDLSEGEFATLLADSPGWLRTILVESLEKLRPAP